MRFFSWIQSNRSAIATAAAGVFLAATGVAHDSWAWVPFVIGVVFTVVALHFERQRRDELHVLRGERDAARQQYAALQFTETQRADMIENALQKFAHACLALCTADANDCRATVYIRDNAEWVRMRRYSANPIFREAGRDRLPLQYGLFAAALSSGRASRKSLSSGQANYEREQQRLGLEPGAADLLSMKSRSYALLRLEGAVDGARDLRIYILVLESIDPQAVDGDVIWPQVEHWIGPVTEILSHLTKVDAA